MSLVRKFPPGVQTLEVVVGYSAETDWAVMGGGAHTQNSSMNELEGGDYLI